MRQRLNSLGLGDIVAKVDARERLDVADGVRLFECPDLHAVGWLANRERERRHGGTTYYNFNLRLEADERLRSGCLFARSRG